MKTKVRCHRMFINIFFMNVTQVPVCQLGTVYSAALSTRQLIFLLLGSDMLAQVKTVAFVDTIDQDQTEDDVLSDLGSMLSIRLVEPQT